MWSSETLPSISTSNLSSFAPHILDNDKEISSLPNPAATSESKWRAPSSKWRAPSAAELSQLGSFDAPVCGGQSSGTRTVFISTKGKVTREVKTNKVFATDDINVYSAVEKVQRCVLLWMIAIELACYHYVNGFMSYSFV